MENAITLNIKRTAIIIMEYKSILIRSIIAMHKSHQKWLMLIVIILLFCGEIKQKYLDRSIKSLDTPALPPCYKNPDFISECHRNLDKYYGYNKIPSTPIENYVLPDDK